jgi:hypothetical protein
MLLMTKNIKDVMPTLDETAEMPAEKQRVYLKIFDPTGRGTWFATSFDGEDTLFGYVVSPLGPDCDELGYFSLKELSEVRGRMGLPLERDLSWSDEATLWQVMERGKR